MEDPVKIQQIFPTVIYNALLKDPAIQAEMKPVVDNITWNSAGGVDWGKTHKISTKDFGENEIEKYNFINFKNSMEFHLKKYLEELRMPFTKYRATSWFTRFDKGDFAISHHHGHADVSGCYYYKATGGGNLYLESPNVCGDAALYHSYHNQMQIHPPVVGKLILFPGWLRHGVTMNESPEERISFAFNIFFNRN